VINLSDQKKGKKEKDGDVQCSLLFTFGCKRLKNCGNSRRNRVEYVAKGI